METADKAKEELKGLIQEDLGMSMLLNREKTLYN
jgi:hypothetical protein